MSETAGVLSAIHDLCCSFVIYFTTETSNSFLSVQQLVLGFVFTISLYRILVFTVILDYNRVNTTIHTVPLLQLITIHISSAQFVCGCCEENVLDCTFLKYMLLFLSAGVSLLGASSAFLLTVLITAVCIGNSVDVNGPLRLQPHVMESSAVDMEIYVYNLARVCNFHIFSYEWHQERKKLISCWKEATLHGSHSKCEDLMSFYVIYKSNDGHFFTFLNILYTLYMTKRESHWWWKWS